MTNQRTKHIVWLVPLLVAFFLYEMIFLGKDPLAGDVVAHYPIGKWGDEYVAEKGELPQWFPHLFGGMPAYAGYAYAPSDPLGNLLKALQVNRGIRYWFYFSIGGIGMFLFLRRRQLGNFASLFGATVFTLTPYMFGLINAGHSAKIYAIGFLPLVLLAADYLLRERVWRGALYLGLAGGLQLWTKHPQIVYYTWMMVVFMWLWPMVASVVRKEWSARKEGVRAAGLVSALILTGLLVIDPYASIYQFQGHSNRGAPSVLDKSGDTERGTSWDYATGWSFHPKETISFIYPYFYGLQNYPSRDLKSQAYWGYMPFTQSTHYVGLLVILLAVLGLLLKKPDRFTTSMAVASIIILIVGFGSYFPVLFWSLFKFAPMFSKFRIPSMIYILLPFTLAYLAASGLENVLEVFKSKDNGRIKRLKKMSAVVFGCVIVSSLLLLLLGDGGSQWLGLFSKSGEVSRYQPQVLRQLVTVRHDIFQKGLLLVIVISGAGFGAIWLGIRRMVTPSVAGLILLSITVVDLWIVDSEFLNLKRGTAIRSQFRVTPEVKFLLEDDSLFRIMPVEDFNSNWYAYFGLSSVGGYRPVKLRSYQDLMDGGGLNSAAVLNMLNVKYLLTSREIQADGMWTEQLLDFQSNRNVYENMTVLPRAWLVARVQSVLSQDESLQAVLQKDFDPDAEAIVVNYEGPELSPDAGGSVEVVAYEENEIVIRTTSETGGLLVLSENYYRPGWSATVDSEPTPIYQTNHVLRSVTVPSGEHLVTFTAEATLFRSSRLTSRISLTVTLLAVVLMNRRRYISLFSRSKERH